MFHDIWGWFDKCEQAALQSGDSLRLRMIALCREGWNYRKLAQGESAIGSFEEALKIAVKLHEPCWQAFFRFWIAVIRLYVIYDYQGALDDTVRLVTEIRKQPYENCVMRGAIVYLLAKIYYFLDYAAYESEILKLFDYLENEVGMDEDSYLQLQASYVEIEIYKRHYDTAKAKAQELINLSTGWPFRLYDAYRSLRRVAFMEGELSAALEYNRIAQKHSQAMVIQNCIAAEKLWEAVLLKYLGEDTAAAQSYYQAQALYEEYKIPHDADYLLASAEYLELDKQTEAALKMVESLLPALNERPSIGGQIDAWYVYIALLARSKRDFSTALVQAKAIAQQSLKPETHLERLAWLEAGNYFEYEWQKKSRKNNLGEE